MEKKAFVMSVILGMVLPTLLFYNAGRIANSRVSEEPSAAVHMKPMKEPETVYVSVVDKQGTVQKMELDTYLLGVVLGELPGSFHTEAIKAQVVAVRTLTLRRLSSDPKHGEAAVCMESGCCQAFCDPREYEALGGDASFIKRVETCISETKNQVLIYEDVLIDAAYFSCSGGRTEDALAVWGTDVPYLQSADSPGEEFASHYTDTVTMDVSDFQKALGLSDAVSEKPYVESVLYTRGGGVESITISGSDFTGMEFRTLLNLRSTNFTVTVSSDQVTITTKGFGHRVGMSQYGAEAMALEGYSYDQILLHYYAGTRLVRWDGKTQ